MYLYATICALTKEKDMQDLDWYEEEFYIEDYEDDLFKDEKNNDSEEIGCNCSNGCWDCLDLRKSDFI